MRVLRPADGIVAFYDGRVEGYRSPSEQNWVDDGALGSGIASYAIVDGDEALVYDTHVSVAHARFDPRGARQAGASTRFTVVLSHWHLDHIAGTEAFADCEVIANEPARPSCSPQHRAAIEAGTKCRAARDRPARPPHPHVQDRERRSTSARPRIELIDADIHSDDATVLWLPERRAAARRRHAGGHRHLRRRARRPRPPTSPTSTASGTSDPERILPNHGDPEVIAAGGYGQVPDPRHAALHPTSCSAARRAGAARTPRSRSSSPAPLQAGWITYFAPYEAVHRENVAARDDPAP